MWGQARAHTEPPWVVPRGYPLCSVRSGRRELQGPGPEVGTGLAWEGSGPGPGRETPWHETR